MVKKFENLLQNATFLLQSEQQISYSSTQYPNITIDSILARKQKDIVTTVSLLILVGIGYYYREGLSVLFNKEKMQTRTLSILEELNALPKIQSYLTYVFGFTIWEIFGMSTIPVETAAGIVFGWNGLFLSGSGKLLGAVLAFCIGRYGKLAKFVQKQLSKNSFLQLVEKSTDDNQLLPDLSEGQALQSHLVYSRERFSKPSARYTEA